MATLSSYPTTTGGSFKVTVTNTTTGCSKTTASPVIVTVNSLPAATITPQGPTTFCAGDSVLLKANTGTGLTHQWLKNAVNIAGATGKNYKAKTAGTYKVKVTNSNGCVKFSSGVVVTVPCREEENISEENYFDVKVYPNPSSGDFMFELKNESSENISINVYDMVGKRILSESIHNSAFIIYNSQLSPGVYAATITDGRNKKVLRLIKTK